MEISITVTVLLTLLISVRVVCGQCTYEDCYNDPLEVLNSIKAYPDNYQQLLNAFYPINRAKPSSVIIAYFTNYTNPLPEVCSLGTYPGISICCIDIYAISYNNYHFTNASTVQIMHLFLYIKQLPPMLLHVNVLSLISHLRSAVHIIIISDEV